MTDVDKNDPQHNLQSAPPKKRATDRGPEILPDMEMGVQLIRKVRLHHLLAALLNAIAPAGRPYLLPDPGRPRLAGFPDNSLLSGMPVSSQVLFPLERISLSVLCLSLERSRDWLQHSCGLAGAGLERSIGGQSRHNYHSRHPNRLAWRQNR
jgi:hypothetical protein